jgi:hypothetical protein
MMGVTQTDALMFELLKKTTDLQALGYEVTIMGDFNGRCLQKCEFSSNNILHKLRSSVLSLLLSILSSKTVIVDFMPIPPLHEFVLRHLPNHDK